MQRRSIIWLVAALVAVGGGILAYIFWPAEQNSAAVNTKKSAPATLPQPSNWSIERYSEHPYDFAYSEDHEGEKTSYSEVYGTKVDPPAMNLGQDISKLSLAECLLLQAELHARHGYLFENAFLRAYFDRFKWYQPVFWEEKYRYEFTPAEAAFEKRLVGRADSLQKLNFKLDEKGQVAANVDNIVNVSQFGGLKPFLPALQKNGFIIVPAKHEHLFNVYEENEYRAVSNFVTTDVYLELLHRYLDFVLRKVEEEKFIGILQKMSTGMQAEALKLAKTRPELAEAKRFADAYFQVTEALLNPAKKPTDAIAAEEVSKINAHSDKRGSTLLNDLNFDYTLFKPRGHYTRNESLKRYFKAFQWIQKGRLFLDKAGENNEYHRTVVMAWLLKSGKAAGGEKLLDLYNKLYEPLRFLVGETARSSVLDLMKLMETKPYGNDAAKLFQPANMEDLRQNMEKQYRNLLTPAGKDADVEWEVRRPALCLMPARYTPDAEILQRLIHVLDPEPKRPFPKAMDLMAAYGHDAAQDILLNELKEGEKWPAYADSLKAVRAKFENFKDWDKTVYNQYLGGIIKITQTQPEYPFFMQRDAWDRKDLNTALAGYTQLKHDMVLYAEQPNAAEMGDGPGIPSPVTFGYVEPNIAFWKNSQELLKNIKGVLSKHKLWTESLAEKHKGVVDIGDSLLLYSEKEIRKERLTDAQYFHIRSIGGEIEWATLAILEVTGWYEITGPEKRVPLVTDIYTYKNQVLEEAVGYAHEIYTVVEMNGLLYLTKGAVFSYYEFTQPSAERLTDDEWQAQLDKGKVPASPVWLKGIVIPEAKGKLQAKEWNIRY